MRLSTLYEADSISELSGQHNNSKLFLDLAFIHICLNLGEKGPEIAKRALKLLIQDLGITPKLESIFYEEETPDESFILQRALAKYPAFQRVMKYIQLQVVDIKKDPKINASMWRLVHNAILITMIAQTGQRHDDVVDTLLQKVKENIVENIIRTGVITEGQQKMSNAEFYAMVKQSNIEEATKFCHKIGIDPDEDAHLDTLVNIYKNPGKTGMPVFAKSSYSRRADISDLHAFGPYLGQNGRILGSLRNILVGGLMIGSAIKFLFTPKSERATNPKTANFDYGERLMNAVYIVLEAFLNAFNKQTPTPITPTPVTPTSAATPTSAGAAPVPPVVKPSPEKLFDPETDVIVRPEVEPEAEHNPNAGKYIDSSAFEVDDI